MGITLSTSTSELDAYFEEYVKRQQSIVVRNMLYCAEEIVNAARKTDSYKDQTGNLRSSIGCVVAVDGKIVHEYGFEVVKDGKEGCEKGKRYAQQLVSSYPNGIVLIVVAGMNYAAYVSAKGYDVLDSAELLAEKLVPMYLKQLKLL